MENITVRPSVLRIYGKVLRPISNANPTGGIKAGDNAAFDAEPQGYGVANRMAERPETADRPVRLPENASSVAVSWPGALEVKECSRNRGHIAS
jgi:hypothetical protein